MEGTLDGLWINHLLVSTFRISYFFGIFPVQRDFTIPRCVAKPNSFEFREKQYFRIRKHNPLLGESTTNYTLHTSQLIITNQLHYIHIHNSF